MRRIDMQTLTRSTVALLGAALLATIGAPAELRGQVTDPPAAVDGFDKPVRVLSGRITYDVRLNAQYDWLLRGDVVVASPARVTVDTGARVAAEPGSVAALIVESGAQVIVVGSATVEVPVLTDVAPAAALIPAGPALPAPPPVDVRTAATDAAVTRLTAAFVVPARPAPGDAASEPAPAVETATPAEAPRAGEARALERSTTTLAQTELPTQRLSAARATKELGSAALATSSADSRRGIDRQIGPPVNVTGLDKPVRVIFGRFTENILLTSDTYWVLRGAVFIGAPGVLTIQPGTRVVGELATTGTLVIERGARIIADGTAAQPIVFTSDQPVGQRGRGDWGGVVINGNAPLNLSTGVGIGEGGTGLYGGTDPNDSSGILRYVRVEFAGIEFSPDNELNGIAFQGVGRGTIVDHVQVHFNKDDGLEMFGGTVDIKHAIVTGSGDDSFDWTHGWQGRAQFLIAQQRGDDADRAFEADNLAGNNEFLPRSMPTIYNFTLIGDPDTNEGTQSTQGMEFREGTAGHYRNFIVTGFKLQAFRVTGNSSLAQVAAGTLAARHGISFGNGTNLHSSANTLVAASGGTVNVVDPMIVRPFDHANPDFRPAPTSPALTIGFETPPNDGFFDTTVTYRGALSADPAEDWTLGWTSYAQQ